MNFYISNIMGQQVEFIIFIFKNNNNRSPLFIFIIKIAECIQKNT
jgi:hypothetical protein